MLIFNELSKGYILQLFSRVQRVLNYVAFIVIKQLWLLILQNRFKSQVGVSCF